MSVLLKAAREGFAGALSVAGTLAKLFLLHLPCILFLSLPAFLIGYAWCWIVGGFRSGGLAFEQMTEDKAQAEFWRVEITTAPTPEGAPE